MNKVISRKYYKNKLWKITITLDPMYVKFGYTGDCKYNPSKEKRAFYYIKSYAKKVVGNGYQFVRLTREVSIA